MRANTTDATSSTARDALREEQLDLLRAHFIARGSSLAQWCAKNAVDRSYAYQVVRGQRRGPQARNLLRRIKSAARGPL